MSPLDADLPLPRTRRLIEAGREQGLHPGVQLYVSIAGEVVADAACGWAAADVPLQVDSLLPWLSSGKPFTAAAVLQWIERGEIGLDDPVGRFIPEFAAQGKGEVTIGQLLTHTAGLLPIETGWPGSSWGEIVQRICRSRLRTGWRPGRQAAYDPARSWFILGEILQRLDGRPFVEIIRSDVCEPLGASDAWVALSREQVRELGDRLGRMHHCEQGECRPAALPVEEELPPSPGGSFIGPARQLGRLYECLLAGGELRGRRLLAPETVEQMCSRQRVGLFDLTFQHQLDCGLGVFVNSNRYGAETVPYGFGRYASPEAFGHGGAQSSVAFADPRHRLAAAVVANGSPGEAAHQQRHRELCSAIYEDLGLA